jgi:hypothetical protein
MRERSHKKGEIYQQDVKHWLSNRTFCGLDATVFGDAYDVTKKACTIGGIAFDFSLRLGRGDVGRHVLYGECKYRNEVKGAINAEFREFLRRVFEALKSAESDEMESAWFVFVSNLPPEDWRAFLSDRVKYCSKTLNLKPVDQQIIQRMARVVSVLILAADIVARV